MPALLRVQPVLMCRDVPASIDFYVQRLGFTFLFHDDPANPRYAGVGRDGIELHLQWHDAVEWTYPNDRPTYRFIVDDVDALFAEFQSRGGLSSSSAVRDTPWNTREFHVRDPDINGLQFYRPLKG
jgi:catechol 2,3-dioxygenase-like lactoylglutathione lyase family enzyme